MTKNLWIKTLLIIVVLLAFLYGIFGLPQKLSGEGLKADAGALPIEIVGMGRWCESGAGELSFFADGHQSIGLAVGERAEESGVDDGENRGVRADA